MFVNGLSFFCKTQFAIQFIGFHCFVNRIKKTDTQKFMTAKVG